MKKPQPIEIEETQVEQLIEKAQQGRLDAADQKRLVPLLRTLVWIQRTLLETRISLSRLKRMLFEKSSEKRPRKPDTEEGDGGKGAGGNSDRGSGLDGPLAGTTQSSSETPQETQMDESDTPNARGHGRRAAADYHGAETVFCSPDEYQSGDRCPQCERSRLYHLAPLVRLRFTGQPLGLTTRFELERLHCGSCGFITVASMPPEAGRETYDVSLKVNLVLAHYHLLSANTPKQHQAQTLDINCIIHGRRNFVELEAYFPDECTHVIDVIAKVYKNEAHCKKQKLTPQQRLAYHQEHSRAVMDGLKVWMEKQFEDRCVEPNSRLGGAFNYLLKRWDSLTRFLHIPGAPLDNNSAERALKMIQRIRKNSLSYANEHGAYVGDVITSLIETCRLNGTNPLDYLTALVKNRSALFRDPGAWLPWNYRDTLETETDPLSHPPPVIDQFDRLGVTVPQ